jgi:type IV pilus assembly protein PilW
MKRPNGLRITQRARQRGFGVVELMIALTLALVLVGGVATIAVGSRQSSRVEQNLAQMQDTGRFAIELINRELRKSGFRPISLAGSGIELVFDASSGFAPRAVVLGTDTSVTNRFRGNGDTFTSTCLNAPAPDGHIVVQTLSVINGNLSCTSAVTDPATTAVTNAVGALVPNVSAIRVTYGVDTAIETDEDDRAFYPDVYVNGPAMTAAQWPNVGSINVQVLVVSPEDNLAEAPQPYRALNGQIVTPADRRLYRSYSTVIALRNMLQ